MKCLENEIEEKPKFPRLMKNNDSDCIILATGYMDGHITGVALNRSSYSNGRNGVEWWNPENYEDYKGSVTLEND